MSGGFDTRVDGSPSSVQSMATWMRESLRSSIEGASDYAVSARQRASAGFHGQAGAAYNGYTTTVIGEMDSHAETISRAAQCFDDYGARLTLCQDRMEAFRTAAASYGLTVAGTVIREPSPAESVAALPAGATQQQLNAHAKALDAFNGAVFRMQMYQQLLDEAEWEVQSFLDWIDANLTAKLASFESPEVTSLLKNLEDNAGSLGLAVALEASKKRNERILDRLRDRYKDRRSGDPRRSSGARDPETRAKVRQLLREAGLLRKGIRVLGPASLLYDTYGGLEEDKPAGGLLAVATGAVGTAVVIALAPVEAPAAGVVVVAVGVGYGVSEGTEAGWDALPDKFTDPVDQAVGNAWGDVKDGAVQGGEWWLDITGFR